MKQRFFCFSMYVEALRRLRLCGFVGMALLLLEAVLGPIITNNSGVALEFIEPISLTDAHPFIAFSFYLFAPLMMLTLFHFLNNRNSSDFYHALPQTRTALFVSFLAAILTWLSAIIVITSFVSVFLYTVLPTTYVCFSLSNILLTLLGAIASCIFVMGAMSIVVSLTGTPTTNILLSGLIIFLPRAIIAMATEAVIQVNSTLVMGRVFPFLDAGYNLVTASPAAVFNVHSSADAWLAFWPGALYTLTVGLLYAGLGLWLFNRRQSEWAEKSAPNRRWQTVFRLSASALVCMIACTYLFASRNTESDTVIILYTLAVIVYFAYELITSRSFRGLKQALPGLGILCLLNVAMFLGLSLMYRLTLYAPSAESVSAVNIRLRNSYFDEQFSRVCHEDPEMIALLSEALRQNVEEVKENFPNGSRRYGAIVEVVFHSGISRTRYVWLNNEQYESLKTMIAQHPAYAASYQLPPLNEITSISLGVNRYLTEDLPEHWATLYAALQKDLEAMSEADRVYFFMNGLWSDADLAPTLTLYPSSYPEGIVARLFPERAPTAFMAYMAICNELHAKTLDFSTDFEYYDKEFRLYRYGRLVSSSSAVPSNEKDRAALFEQLFECSQRTPTAGEYVLTVWLNHPYYSRYECYLPVSQEDFALWRERFPEFAAPLLQKIPF